MAMAAIELNLPYPISANRYWRNRGNVRYLSKEAQAYKRAVAASAAGVKPLGGAVELRVTVLPKQTKSGAASKVCIDLDNSLKVLCDALNGVAYQDDKQVKRIVAEYGEPVSGGGVQVGVKPYAKGVEPCGKGGKPYGG